MDMIEKWLVDQAQDFQGDAREAVLLVATRWHDVGEDVLAKRLNPAEDALD